MTCVRIPFPRIAMLALSLIFVLIMKNVNFKICIKFSFLFFDEMDETDERKEVTYLFFLL